MLAISPQDVDSHARWIAKEHFPFALLADAELTVAEAFGVKGGRVIPLKRSVFLVDTPGVVRYRYEGTVRAIFKKPKDLVKVLDRLV